MNIKIIVIIVLLMILMLFVVYCIWVTSSVYFSFSIVLVFYNYDG